MSDLQFFKYETVGVARARDFKYSQAVRVGDLIECCGQGGWDPHTDVIPTEINAQINQAFETVQHNLKDAGGKGWEQVYKVRSYHLPLNNESIAAMVRNFKKWCPNHEPLWTCVGAQRLGEDDMRVEIEVTAYDPQSKQ